MRLKTFLGIGLVMALVIVTLLTAVISKKSEAQNSSSKSNDAQKLASKIPVNVTQLPAEKGIIPVELKCESAELASANRLEKLSCTAINNTSKSISALVADYDISLKDNGKSDLFSGAITVEMLLHPSFYERRKHTFIQPSEETPINLMPTTFEESSVIEEMTLQINYVEFEDGSAIGRGTNGEKIIRQIRQGIVIYRDWLIKKYTEGGKSETSIVGLIENSQSISKENLGDLTPKQLEGAKILQKFIRRIYSSEGIEGLKAILK